ncbi:MAG: ATP-binding cassette domain-containing protein [Ktedonobacteraceae bacterium]
MRWETAQRDRFRVTPPRNLALCRPGFDRQRLKKYLSTQDGTMQQQEQHALPVQEKTSIRVDALRLNRIVNERTLLLHDISLTIPQRAFVALVGGSGVGKSTLMYALSGIQPAQQGTVLYNGYDYYRHLDAFSSDLGYVPQDDIIHRRLAVRRALYYAAKMRLPKHFTQTQIRQRIDEVLHDVGIEHRRHILVSKLSGGERKRVSIALELLADPSIFFLDEPTSGLDPGLDYKMMHLLRDLAEKGRTVVLVTHTIMNIDVCDYVCFLARGGRLAYYGPPEEAKTYFGTTNFAEIYTQLEPTEANPHIPEEAEERFKRSPYYTQYILDPQQQERQERAGDVKEPMQPHATIRIGGWKQFLLLSQRYMELLKNDPGNLLILLLQAPIIGLILVYLAGQGAFDPTSVVQCPTRANLLSRTGPIVSIDCQRVVDVLHSSQGVVIAQQRGETKEEVFQNAILPNSGADAQTLLFIMGFAAVLFGCINGAREIVKERPIYQRERMVNVGLVPYLFSKLAVLGVLSLLQSALLVFLVNLKAPLQQGIIFPPALEIYISMALTALAGLMLGLTISALAPNTDRAMSFVPLILIPQVIFSGILFKLNTPLLQILGAFFAMRWAMAGMGSSIGLHANKLGVDNFAYQGTLFASLNPDPNSFNASVHLVLVWGILVFMILVLGLITAYCLRRKEVQQ